MSQDFSISVMHEIDQRLRTQRAERLATRRAALGALPAPEPLHLFRRRVVSLGEPVEIGRIIEQRRAATRPAA